MKPYKTKIKQLSGTDFKEIRKKSTGFYNEIKRQTKKKPYVRSKYFKKEKIFLELFWGHLFEKNYWDQTRRMKLFPCAIELIRNSDFAPVSKENVDKPSEILHRFAGITATNDCFLSRSKRTNTPIKNGLFRLFQSTIINNCQKEKDPPLIVAYKPRAEDLLYPNYIKNSKNNQAKINLCARTNLSTHTHPHLTASFPYHSK